MIKKRINNNIQDKDTVQYVYGWCVMSSNQPAANNSIIIYTDGKKPRRGSNGWEGDNVIFFGPTNDDKLIEGRTPTSPPILVKMKVEIP